MTQCGPKSWHYGWCDTQHSQTHHSHFPVLRPFSWMKPNCRTPGTLLEPWAMGRLAGDQKTFLLVLCSTCLVVGTQGQITDSRRCLWCWRKKRTEERWMLVSELDNDEAVHASCVVVFRGTLPRNAHIQKNHHGNTATQLVAFRFAFWFSSGIHLSANHRWKP
jgi:hypothetical protein